MATATANLPQKSEQLAQLINQLVARYQPLQIFQFGEVQQRETFDTLFAAAAKHHMEMYFLLVVMPGETQLAQEVQDFASAHFAAGTVTVFTHGQAYIKRCLTDNNYFFAKVLGRGAMLYSAKAVPQQLEVPKPNAQWHLAKSQSHWKNRIKMARGFWAAAEKALEEGHDRVLVFLLHQTIEQVCLGLIWVFMGYQSDTRDLKRLLYTCACFSKQPLQNFMGSSANQKALALLMQHYNRDCYHQDLELDGASLYRLLDLVEGFVVLGEELFARIK